MTHTLRFDEPLASRLELSGGISDAMSASTTMAIWFSTWRNCAARTGDRASLICWWYFFQRSSRSWTFCNQAAAIVCDCRIVQRAGFVQREKFPGERQLAVTDAREFLSVT